jgi:UDP-N-acetylmuramate: L-alanyl-gamma-D-glutamyl-meso-diaminopimelate ligase
MRIHLIACGGSVMHNLTIALKLKGFEVTGSDDEIYEPAKTRLQDHGLLPTSFGWDERRIAKDIDYVILGMHAKKDNPELLKAQALGITVYSYPEYIYELSKNKTRVVIGGSHGKTTITSIILHVLKFYNKDFDYLVGAQIEGFDTMVKITEAPIIVLEGDEYLASPIDRRPKFHLYHPHIALLTGIAWDHVNVFPTFHNYLDQFEIFINSILKDGSLITYKRDEYLNKMMNANADIEVIEYEEIPHIIKDGVTFLTHEGIEYPITLFGDHNMQNLEGAMHACEKVGISNIDFIKAIVEFKGAAKRLDLLAKSEHNIVYKDFAHSPSKLEATINAVKKQHPENKLVSCMELHTFSSLTKSFLKEYSDTMSNTEEAIVFINKRYFEIKNLEAFDKMEVIQSFNRPDLKVFFDAEELKTHLEDQNWKKSNLLLMSSGNFGQLDLQAIANKVAQ